MNNKNMFIYFIYALLFIITSRWVYVLYFINKKESFTTDFSIANECRDVTPKKLLEIFNNDKEKLSNVLSDHDVPIDLITNKSSYPVIATYLLLKGIIKKCN